MHVQLVELRNFRNYESAELALSRGTVVIHGPNGAGKTNLLEAIALASVGDPVRAREVGELVRAGQEYAYVAARHQVASGLVRVEVGLARSGRTQYKVGGVLRRRADLIGLAPVVYFSADDLEVVQGEPSARRRLLDLGLSAVSRGYYFQLARYRRGLEQRNRLLKEIREGREREAALEGWDRTIARYGARVMVERQAFVGGLAPAVAEAYRRISGDERQFLLRYRPSLALPGGQTGEGGGKDPRETVELLSSQLAEAWRESREADIRYGTTMIGPHRDDLELLLADRSVRGFASQGEQRTCALAIRMGLAARMQELTGEMPALLLDDVLSELDERHREGVFAAARMAEQVIITCCDVEDVPPEPRASAHLVEVVGGNILAAAR